MLMLSRSSFSEIQTVVTNMTGYDNKRLDGRNKKKQYNYTAVRMVYEYTAAAIPVRTQGNGMPPGEL